MMKALSTWHIPFRTLNTSRDIDELFSFGGWDRAGMSWRLVPIGYVPQIDSYLDGNTVCIKADLPGVDPKEVELTVKDNQLTLKGVKDMLKALGTKAESA